METLFVHFNNHTNTPSTKGVPRKNLHKPSYTFAGKIVEGSTLLVGVSQCSARDQFCKKVGRAKAEGRALSTNAQVFAIPQDVLETNKIGKFFAETCKTLI